MTSDTEPVLNQLLVPEHLWSDVAAWLSGRGFQTARLPAELFGDEELPTYILIPTDCLTTQEAAAARTVSFDEAVIRIRDRQEEAVAYAKTFDTVPSDEAAAYIRDRLFDRPRQGNE
jgi:hypothetical protein